MINPQSSDELAQEAEIKRIEEAERAVDLEELERDNQLER